MTDMVLEHLKRFQKEFSDIKSDLRELKSSAAMQLSLTGELVKARGRDEERFAELEMRMERIERRLDLHDER